MAATRSRPRLQEVQVTIPAPHAALVRFYVENTLGGTVRTDVPGGSGSRALVLRVEERWAERLAGFLDCVTLIAVR
jgi:hypothetical protein